MGAAAGWSVAARWKVRESQQHFDHSGTARRPRSSSDHLFLAVRGNRQLHWPMADVVAKGGV
eukprot:372953-Prymnesium_polylepis.1